MEFSVTQDSRTPEPHLCPWLVSAHLCLAPLCKETFFTLRETGHPQPCACITSASSPSTNGTSFPRVCINPKAASYLVSDNCWSNHCCWGMRSCDSPGDMSPSIEKVQTGGATRLPVLSTTRGEGGTFPKSSGGDAWAMSQTATNKQTNERTEAATHVGQMLH